MSERLLAFGFWAEPWRERMVQASWQGAVVLAVAWAIGRWCTFLSPRAICWIWRLACLKLVVALLWVQPINLPLYFFSDGFGQTLLHAMLIVSAADAAYTLANTYGPGLNAFVAQMNATAGALPVAASSPSGKAGAGSSVQLAPPSSERCSLTPKWPRLSPA